MKKVDITEIKTEEDYLNALRELRKVFHAEIGSEEEKKSSILFDLIESYENKHYNIDDVLPNDLNQKTMDKNHHDDRFKKSSSGMN